MQANCAQPVNRSQDTNNSMLAWSDEALISWITTRQQSACIAISTLIKRHRPWIYRRCQFRLGNHHDAEDATQDIVMRVYTKLHQFQGRAQFKSWLNTIIDNYCNSFSLRRARYITSEHIEQLIESCQQEDVVDPYLVIAETEQMRLLLSSLPENARQVLYLRFFDEHSLEEIARVLCLTLSAAKARLYRAIEQLKHHYLQSDDVKPLLRYV